MKEKNYLTREEQKVWSYIKDKKIIDNELITLIFPDFSPNKRNKLLHNLYKKGYLNKVRKDLYFIAENLDNFYELALRIHKGYISLNSALKLYNLIEYEDFIISIMTKDFYKIIELKNTNYSIRFIPLGKFFCGFTEKDNLPLSTLEKTFFDCFYRVKYVGYTNLTKALFDAKIDWKLFLSYFKLSGNRALFQKTGYVLDLMREKTKFKVPEFVLTYFNKRKRYPVKLSSAKKKSKFNKKWLIEDNVGEKQILSWWY